MKCCGRQEVRLDQLKSKASQIGPQDPLTFFVAPGNKGVLCSKTVVLWSHGIEQVDRNNMQGSLLP